MQQYTLAELAEMEHNIHEAIKQITEQKAKKNKQHIQALEKERKKTQEKQQQEIDSLTQQLNEAPHKEETEPLSQEEITNIVAMINLVDENFEETMHEECVKLKNNLEETSKGLTTGEITKKEFGQEVINGLKSIFIKQQANNPTLHVGDYEKLQKLQEGVERLLEDFDIQTKENEGFLINLKELEGYIKEYCYM